MAIILHIPSHTSSLIKCQHFQLDLVMKLNASGIIGKLLDASSSGLRETSLAQEIAGLPPSNLQALPLVVASRC